jgi:hypothetical protein
VSPDDHDRLSRLHVGTTRQNPLCIQPLLAYRPSKRGVVGADVS